MQQHREPGSAFEEALTYLERARSNVDHEVGISEGADLKGDILSDIEFVKQRLATP